ncbi:hypothetical protein GCM10010435_70700 [Winogradskya consettensis]|uniref:Membrane alanyl aminopeptidase n=1 Tax=Winogradskya consettensis TaxID=113560 RepID=A0A919SMB6_9ACTN|nr:hypothetical protein Aco04nite_45410 [Actinoplanes consettensis]
MLLRAYLSCLLVAGLLVAGATPAPAAEFRPGAAGLGDPYFPLAGNGGYDVQHYGLDITYTPKSGQLAGVATIEAVATQGLSSFNLDFDALTLRSLTVNGQPARWRRANGELTVTPGAGLRRGRTFTVVARYDGVPQIIEDSNLGASGVFRTDDGMVIAGQPEVASSWFPVNDHPLDKASYTIRVTAPQGLQAIANGVLKNHLTRHGWTTWTWDAREPMASYLATATVGEYRVTAYRKNGIRFLDALDPKLFTPAATPRTGTHMALSRTGEPAYKRLTRTITVPRAGATVSFWADRDTEYPDYFFVEARPAGTGDWTTLPDTNGHTSNDTDGICEYGERLHPFLLHYVTVKGCEPSGTTGDWNAATGESDGYEHWSVDLDPYASKKVEISLTTVNDDAFTLAGAAVDDVVVSTGDGSTSFEAGLGGWKAAKAPAGSSTGATTWIAGTVADLPPTTGDFAAGSLAREPEILDFLGSVFGRYPFSAAGGIVDADDGLGFALENQTRPIYAQAFFTSPADGDSVVVHELAHQWYGDSLAVARWQDIWLNEGFATYAEWLWAEHEGLSTAQEEFDSYAGSYDGDESFWELPIGDPGPEHLFDRQVYTRGAMTLHALRLAVGDKAFFRILKKWVTSHAGGNVTTPDFITLAEKVSGKQLDALFDTWLYSPVQPASSVPS